MPENPEVERIRRQTYARLMPRFEVNDLEEVVMITQGERRVLGKKDQVCEEMVRFLAEIDYGE